MKDAIYCCPCSVFLSMYGTKNNTLWKYGCNKKCWVLHDLLRSPAI